MDFHFNLRITLINSSSGVWMSSRFRAGAFVDVVRLFVYAHTTNTRKTPKTHKLCIALSRLLQTTGTQSHQARCIWTSQDGLSAICLGALKGTGWNVSLRYSTVVYASFSFFFVKIDEVSPPVPPDWNHIENDQNISKHICTYPNMEHNDPEWATVSYSIEMLLKSSGSDQRWNCPTGTREVGVAITCGYGRQSWSIQTTFLRMCQTLIDPMLVA